MSVFAELGYARGATDKLMGRAFDDTTPREVKTPSAARSYKRSYKKAYDETKIPSDVTGASLSFSASASASTKTSSPAPGDSGTADQGFNAPLPEKAPTFFKILSPKSAVKVAPSVSTTAKQAVAVGPVAEPLMQTMPGAPQELQLMSNQQIAPAAAPGFFEKAKAWATEHWKEIAIGTAVVVVIGGTVYVYSQRQQS